MLFVFVFFLSFEGYSYHFSSGTLACLGGEEKQICLMVRDIVKSSEEFRNLKDLDLCVSLVFGFPIISMMRRTILKSPCTRQSVKVFRICFHKGLCFSRNLGPLGMVKLVVYSYW